MEFFFFFLERGIKARVTSVTGNVGTAFCPERTGLKLHAWTCGNSLWCWLLKSLGPRPCFTLVLCSWSPEEVQILSLGQTGRSRGTSCKQNGKSTKDNVRNGNKAINSLYPCYFFVSLPPSWKPEFFVCAHLLMRK